MSKNVNSALIVTALLAAWLVSGVFTPDTQAQQQSTSAASSAQSEAPVDAELSSVRVSVRTAELRAQNIVLRGQTQAKRAIEVTAEIAGQVVSRPVERGMRVSQGQLLCEIAVDDRAVAVDEARAAYEQARIDHEGSMKLKAQELLSDVAIASSEARREAARAHLHRQVLNLEKTRVTAPFDGVVETLHLNTGDYAMPGASCATLIDLDPMLVVAHVSEEEVGSLQAGSAVAGSTRVGRAIGGQLSFVGTQSDPITRTYPVEVTVANEDYSLRSGQTVKIRVAVERVLAHRVAPSLLTLGDRGDMGVRILDNDNRVVFNAVDIVEDSPEGLWVTGLPHTVSLITVGQEYVTAGEQVEPLLHSPETGQLAAR